MALTPSFTIGISSDPSAIIITDTSTGSDVNVVDRKILLYDVFNNQYGNSPYDFLISGSVITINPLTNDKALLIVVNWVNNLGVPIYTQSQEYAFTGYGEQYYGTLTKAQTSKPNIVNDQVYYSNKSILRDELDSASLAISIMNDLYSAQGCIERYTYMIQNDVIYF